MGSVVFGPATKKATMKSSKLKVKASRNPARMAGKSCGRATCQNVPSDVAYKSPETSISERSLPATRASTMDMVNRERPTLLYQAHCRHEVSSKTLRVYGQRKAARCSGLP